MFGIGAGKIEIILPKRVYSPGEVIQGKILLSLNEPVKAKGLFVKLYAERTVTSRGGKRPSTSTKRVYEFSQPLAGEQEFQKTAQQPSEYLFEVKVPETAGSAGGEGAMAQVMQATQFIAGMAGFGGINKWFIEADLDIPWAFDVKTRVQLSI